MTAGNDPGVLDRMTDPQVRAGFLARKEASYNAFDEDLRFLRDYVMSTRYEEDVARLRSGDFFFAPPQKLRLRKGNSDRRRDVYRFRPEEAVLMKVMAFVLHDYDHLYSDSLFSFRLGKRVTEIFRSISRLDCSRTCWVIKADIHSFGDHVDPEILLAQLAPLFQEKDPALFAFFRALLLRREFIRDGKLIRGVTGALSGCALTNFFENIYLLDVDDHIRAHSAYYCRFADDIAVFTKTEDAARSIYGYLGQVFARRGLSFNEEKTAVLPPGAPFDLLGFCVEKGRCSISEHALGKIEWKLRRYADRMVRLQQRGLLTPDAALQKMIDRANRYFFGRRNAPGELNWVDWSFRILTGCESLKRLDACTQDCIRYAGSGGRRTNARYRIRYKKMRQMGYRTLVHAFYHGYEKL